MQFRLEKDVKYEHEIEVEKYKKKIDELEKDLSRMIDTLR